MVAGLSEKSASACGRIWRATSCQIHDSSNVVDPASLGVRIAVLALIATPLNIQRYNQAFKIRGRWFLVRLDNREFS